MSRKISVTAQESGERIDALLSCCVEGLTRSAAQRLVESGLVTSDGASVKKSARPRAGSEYIVELPETEAAGAPEPQDIAIDVVYEDSDLIVVNKPRGMVVHPAPGHPDGTLVNALMNHCADSLSGIGGELRPGIVHRIDRDTSGLIVAAKNDFAHLGLSAQLADHSLSRVYEAVARGRFRDDAGTVDAPVGRCPTDRKKMAVTERNSRAAVTHWEVIARYEGYTHVRCRLETGRTHQIRVHMAYIGHPLLRDELYSRAKKPEKGLTGQCLHARTIEFTHPRTLERMSFTTELPEYFRAVLARLGPEIG